jgi:hypothetical protein
MSTFGGYRLERRERVTERSLDIAAPFELPCCTIVNGAFAVTTERRSSQSIVDAIEDPRVVGGGRPLRDREHVGVARIELEATSGDRERHLAFASGKRDVRRVGQNPGGIPITRLLVGE